jgi:hypothetical protein
MGKDQLNPKQELFCQLYATDKEFFANGVQSYIEAYNPDTIKRDWYKTACASASQLLSNIKVLNRINELLELRGLNDAYIDKQLEFLITQNTELRTKLSAIQEYNKLKARILEKSEVTHKYEELDDEQLEAAIKAREARLFGTAE